MNVSETLTKAFESKDFPTFNKAVMALLKEAIKNSNYLDSSDMAEVRSYRTSAGKCIELFKQGRLSVVQVEKLAQEIEAL